MDPLKSIGVAFFFGLTGSMFRVDARELSKVPKSGPLIIVTNHVHIPELPTLYTRLFPRKVRALAQAERVFKTDIAGFILRYIGTIPIHRGEADLSALREGLKTLAEGNIVQISPEGTRSHDGRLQKGLPGAILMALHSGAPVLPVVHYGSEGYGEALKHLRRVPLRYMVGRPFRVSAGDQRVTSEIRRKMIDEVMYQMAVLLPPQYRGVYADLEVATTEFLTFLPEAGGD